MDGVIVGGLIAGAVSLGINGIGWTITLISQAKKDATVTGALKQKIEDICTNDVQRDERIGKIDDRVQDIDKKLVEHIARPNHGRSFRR